MDWYGNLTSASRSLNGNSGKYISIIYTALFAIDHSIIIVIYIASNFVYNNYMYAVKSYNNFYFELEMPVQSDNTEFQLFI